MRSPPIPLPARLNRAVDTGEKLQYGVFRAKQGPSGTWHWGVDIPGVTPPVVAPEVATVVHVWTNDKTPPFAGYGPGGVLLRGDSGVYHLLAHMDPTDWSAASLPTVGRRYDEGERVGAVAPSLAHVHWEVRKEPIDSPATRRGNTLDPIAWLRGETRELNRRPLPWWAWVALGWILTR